MKRMILVMGLIFAIMGTSAAAEPPQNFLQLPYQVHGWNSGCFPSLEVFVKRGLTPGKWEKKSSDHWLYRIATEDARTGKNVSIDVSFMAYTVNNFQFAGIEKILVNKRPLSDGQIGAFSDTAANSLLEYEKCNSDTARNKIKKMRGEIWNNKK